MVKHQCHAASGHQTKGSIGSKAEEPMIEGQKVEIRGEIKQWIICGVGGRQNCMLESGRSM